MPSDVGELTLDCHLCGASFTYVKTTGPRRMYCSERCKANAGDIMRKDRHTARVRQCDCGSTDVPKVGKAICKPCCKEQRTRTDYNRKRRLSLYGLSGTSFDELLTEQRGHCAICATEDPGPRGWHIDHDHACCPGIGSCGACVRGLLCHRCNLMLGNAKDSIETLERAVKYLRATSQFTIPVRLVK
jgi:hypothetical protein